MNKRVVDTQAAVVAQQSLSVGVYLGRSVSLHLDVSRQAHAVLALLAAAFNTAVVTNSAVSAVDRDLPAKVHSDIFQHINQGLAYVDKSGTVGAGKLIHLEMGRQLPVGLSVRVVHFYVVYSAPPPQ